VAHFAGSTSLPRETLIRRFAFKLMDIDGNGVIPEVRLAHAACHGRALRG
jgi:hypothetical protein